jgi:O-methyltransferase
MTQKINSSSPFPHDFPYKERYSERIPLLHIFRNAVASLYSNDGRKNTLAFSLRNFASLLFSSNHYLAVECGVYMGHSLIACAEIARNYGIPIHIYGLDTFTGLPALSEVDKLYASQNVLQKADVLFADTSLQDVQSRIDAKKLTKYITLLPGLFNDTLIKLPEKKYFFVNIDCDLYEPHLECLDFFYPRMEQGGIIFFDDYHSVEYPMAAKAIDKFMEGRPERLFHLRFGKEGTNYTKSFIVKY